MPEPKFTAKIGQVDYTHIRYCPVINCVAQYDDKILIVRRSPHMRLYPNYWNGISGFLDDQKSIKEKVLQELNEEAGISAVAVKDIRRGQVLVQESEQYKKTWIIFPIAVSVDANVYTLDWEAQMAAWVTLEEAKKRLLLPGFEEVLDTLFKTR
jgi:isopentenyldiphosphate isomerase